MGQRGGGARLSNFWGLGFRGERLGFFRVRAFLKVTLRSLAEPGVEHGGPGPGEPTNSAPQPDPQPDVCWLPFMGSRGPLFGRLVWPMFVCLRRPVDEH